jgi:hypothetical protein
MGHPYAIGDLVPFRFTWYIILVSYFVSLAGSLTTVELLHRRKPGKGWLSWYWARSRFFGARH